MKFVVYGPDRKLGAVVGERILDLAAAAQSEADRGLVLSLTALIESAERGLEVSETLIARHGGSGDPQLTTAQVDTIIHAPFPGRRIALAGSNNPDHVARGLTNMGRPITSDEVRVNYRRSPAGGFWANAEPAPTGAGIPLPRSSHGLFDFEAEVAIVLARGGKGLKAEQWQERVWGTVLLIDWSIRNHDLLSNKRPFYAHKVFDKSKSLGPWIAVGEVDPMACRVQTRVNGELRQDFDSGNMIYSYWELLEQMSEDLTLYPGDMLAGGTGPGTAADSTIPLPDGRLPLDNFLKAGDVVEVSSPGLGVLTARVVDYDGPSET